MNTAGWHAQRRSFGAAADVYNRARPRYPVAAVDWAVGDRPCRVLDLGAGTGILTRQLIDRGHTVTAVEPNAQMLAALIAYSPGAAALLGSAEQIPLADGSVDAVVAGQAYHWFDPSTAPDEIARVLRPGGVFAPMWNLRDASVSWVRALSDVLAQLEDDNRKGLADYAFGPRFAPIERAEFRHEVGYTVDSLIELVRSRSYYLTSPAKRRAMIEAQIRELAIAHPDLAGRTEFTMPYVTVVLRAPRAD
ncbi:MAG TPA: class I SAM-dependent methyltransferase [Actinomycetes bacterium]|jgi:SAM-dependent methyltransferase|nr:class I SAM-dependent methyltransferase [Actinomycetes bacterium]